MVLPRRGFRLPKDLFGGRDNLGRVLRDADESQLPIWSNNVPDRRRDHMQPGGQIFGGFCRADVSRRFIAGERHDGDIPACEI